MEEEEPVLRMSGGCITQHAEGGIPHDLTFSCHGRIMLTVTPQGELILGGHVKPQELVELLVTTFGKAYDSRLRKASERMEKAEARTRSAERARDEWSFRAARFEDKANKWDKAEAARHKLAEKKWAKIGQEAEPQAEVEVVPEIKPEPAWPWLKLGEWGSAGEK